MRNKHEFCEWANTILRESGIKVRDNGEMALRFEVYKGDVVLADCNTSVPMNHWGSMTRANVETEAREWLSAVDA